MKDTIKFGIGFVTGRPNVCKIINSTYERLINQFNELDKSMYPHIIATTNIPNNNVFAKVKYASLLNDIDYVKDNTGLMLLKLLSKCDVSEVHIFGMDGYVDDSRENYASDELTLKSNSETIHGMNLGIKRFLDSKINIKFIRY